MALRQSNTKCPQTYIGPKDNAFIPPAMPVIKNTAIASNMHRNIDNINGYRMLETKTDENAFNQPSEKERKQAGTQAHKPDELDGL